MTILAVLLLQS